MNENCESMDAKLLALALGDLEAPARLEVESHLAGCERCRRELESLRADIARIKQAFAGSREAPVLSPRRLESLLQPKATVLPVRRANAVSRRQVWGLLAAAGVVGLLTAAIYLAERVRPLQIARQADAPEREIAMAPVGETRSREAALASEQAPASGLAGGASGAASSGLPADQAAVAAREAVPLREGEPEESYLIAGAGHEADLGVASAPAAAPLALADRQDQVARPRSTPGPQEARAELKASAELSADESRRLAGASLQLSQDSAYSEPGLMPLPRPMHPSFPNDAKVDAMFFQNYGVNPFIDTAEDRLSTFAVDVDTASYTVVRSYLNRGLLPPPDAVRVEEFVNYFPADYPSPSGSTFAVYGEVAPSPFRPGYDLLKIGIKGREMDAHERKPVVLTFVVDVSGSMAREDRLGLVKAMLHTLLRELRPGDRVGLAVYGTRGREILAHREVGEEGEIEHAIDRLVPEGSTNAGEGLAIGYDMARRAFDPRAVNRVILCTDGVANVGQTGAVSILDSVRGAAEDRIYLTALGFGMGNYNDVLLEQLADRGNGHYAYLDTLDEARRFVRLRLSGSMEVIAQDVKVQVEFDPDGVERYRLLGYENRDVADRDFRNDSVDAGEIGAGHSTTALYEIRRGEDAASRLGRVRIRFKDPARDLEVREIEGELAAVDAHASFDDASVQFRTVALAAQLAEILRHSYWAREYSPDLLDALAEESLPGDRDHGELADLRDMIGRTAELWVPNDPRPIPMEDEWAPGGTAEPSGGSRPVPGEVPLREVR